jgi:hypothetical protein
MGGIYTEERKLLWQVVASETRYFQIYAGQTWRSGPCVLRRPYRRRSAERM